MKFLLFVEVYDKVMQDVNMTQLYHLLTLVQAHPQEIPSMTISLAMSRSLHNKV